VTVAAMSGQFTVVEARKGKFLLRKQNLAKKGIVKDFFSR